MEKKPNLFGSTQSGRKRIHFIGIGGISMSGLAEILHNQGHRVSGSDSSASAITDRLTEKGIAVTIGQRAENITQDIELVVYTAAIGEDNPELSAARARGIETLVRATLLGLLMKGYRYPISVAGTHGKTTTTSMLTEIFMAAGLDPTVSLGGVLKSIGGTYRTGQSEYCIVESCEYSDTFLQFEPHAAIILNIDNDHLDYFGTMERMEESFRRFVENIPDDGVLVVYGGIPRLKKLTEGLACRIIVYGTPDAQYQAANIHTKDGQMLFTIMKDGQPAVDITLPVPGEHNMQNALAAFATADFYGVPPKAAAEGLSRFLGAKRRFEKKGSVRGIEIVDDYAHHPTAVKATLAAARQICRGRLFCVFQPHNYSRTKELMDEFSAAYDDADVIVVLDIYANREANPGDVHAAQLVDKLKQRGKDARYSASFEDAKKLLFELCIPNDLLITMGAGDVYLLADSMFCTDLSTLYTVFSASR